MSALAKLKLVSVAAGQKSPTVLRRNKLTAHLVEQIAMAKAQTDGETYAGKRVKSVVDAESGERKQVEVSKRVKQWWFTAPNGKLALALRYGAKPICIAKNMNAIEVADMAELITTLGVIKDAVNTGELDTQMEQVSGALRAGFGKKKK